MKAGCVNGAKDRYSSVYTWSSKSGTVIESGGLHGSISAKMKVVSF